MLCTGGRSNAAESGTSRNATGELRTNAPSLPFLRGSSTYSIDSETFNVCVPCFKALDAILGANAPKRPQ